MQNMAAGSKTCDPLIADLFLSHYVTEQVYLPTARLIAHDDETRRVQASCGRGTKPV